ncbi:MAG: hypothetical protein WC378_01415 [Opitutaceae bacterium]|jgi:hypothetical protein
MRITWSSSILAISGVAAVALAWWLSGTSFSRKDVLLGLLTSYAVTVVFYFLVVWFPEQRKRRRIKSGIISHYIQFKKEVLGLVLHAAKKGWSQDDLDRLIIPKEFSEYFSEDETGSGMRWYEVLNGLDDYYVAEIANRLELLRSEVQFVLSSIDIQDQEVFEFMKRLSEISFKMSKMRSDYDGQKSWGHFLWALYSDFDPSVGDVPFDRNLKLLERL